MMNTSDHIRIITAIARKDISSAVKNLVMLSVALGVIVLVGSSQIGVLFQRISGYDIVYIYDTSGYNLAYSPNVPETLRLSAVATTVELGERLLNTPGSALGIVVSAADLQTQIVEASYAHWLAQDKAQQIADITEQFLSAEFDQGVSVRLSRSPIYPDNTDNRLVNSMSIMLIIALFAFCGSLVPTLILEEKRRKTWDILIGSPASVGDIIAGKAIAGLFYGLLTALVALTFFSPYILHWEVAVITSLLGAMLAVSTGLLLGVLLNSYQSINIYSMGLMILLFLPIIPELIALEIADTVTALLQLFPIPALMTVSRMMYMQSISVGVLVLTAIVLIMWIAFIASLTRWLASRIEA